MKNLTLNKRLALIALTLGVIAVFAGNPYNGSHLTINSKDFEYTISKGIDLVKAEDLANQIIKGTSDFKLIDLRSEKDFQVYRIPGAENIPAAAIENSKLLKNEKIILYCSNGINSAQVWTILKAKGYKSVYILSGGLEDWNKIVLFPKISDNPTPEQLIEFEKTKAISKYFGGTPQIGGTTDSKETPKVVAPKLETPTNTGTQTEPKKKKEGC